MAPRLSSFAFGRRGVQWANTWQDVGSQLQSEVDSQGALDTKYYKLLVLGECHMCNIERGQLKASALDLTHVGSVHDKDKKFQDNFMRLPLMCGCASKDGVPRRPVGVRSIIFTCKKAGEFEIECRSQCYSCQTKLETLPPPVLTTVGNYYQLLAVPCCDEPKVKVTSLKMHFQRNRSSVVNLSVPVALQSREHRCGICCELVVDGLVSCQSCPVHYHVSCQREWLSRRRVLMTPKCLFCFSPIQDTNLHASVDVEDIYIHANSNDQSKLDHLAKRLTGVLDHIIRQPKKDVKSGMRSASVGRPPLYLAWYRFSSQQSRDHAYARALNMGVPREAGIRVFDKGENKLRSNRKFGEVFG